MVKMDDFNRITSRASEPWTHHIHCFVDDFWVMCFFVFFFIGGARCVSIQISNLRKNLFVILAPKHAMDFMDFLPPKKRCESPSASGVPGAEEFGLVFQIRLPNVAHGQEMSRAAWEPQKFTNAARKSGEKHPSKILESTTIFKAILEKKSMSLFRLYVINSPQVPPALPD